MIVTIGRGHGAGVIQGWHLPSCVVGVAKGKDLFTKQFWDTMNQKRPS